MLKNCGKCGAEFDAFSKWGEKKFCSRKCANSRFFSEESKLRKSLALKGRKTGQHSGLSLEKLEIRIEKYKQSVRNNLLNSPFEKLGIDRKRRRVFEEQNFCCNNCGLSDWYGKKITLELEHKDGNNQNNLRDNLEGLCPNCHSLTETWRGRNKTSKNGTNKISDEKLLELLKETNNIRQALLAAGLSAKGNNYVRAKKLLNSI